MLPGSGRFNNAGGEARAAAAGAGGVRVLDDELGAFEVILVVNFSAHQVLVAHGVNQQGHAIFGHGGVVFIGDLVKGEAVLKAGAAAALNENAQLELRVAFFSDQVSHLGSSAVGEDKRGGHFGLDVLCNCAHGRLLKG